MPEVADKLVLVLPDPGNTVHVEIGPDHVGFVRIDYDECPVNPLDDCDGMGTIYSFNQRHHSFKHPDELEDDPDRVALSYFEHGNCVWGVQGVMSQMPDFRWDGVEAAGAWYPDDVIRETAKDAGLEGPARKEWMAAQAESACETYTQWCNGEVYFWGAHVYKVRRTEAGELYDRLDDYRMDEAVVEESCGGFYGQEHLSEEVASILKHAVAMLGLDVAVTVEGP